VIRLGIDAINLRGDERGMGRYVRCVIRALAQTADVEVTLLVRDPRAQAAYRTLVGKRITVAPLRRAWRHDAFDVIWYPWTAVRFPARAPALVTVNDDFAFRFPARGFVARAREQRPIRRAIRRADMLATISVWSRTQIATRFHLEPAGIALLPLAPDAFFTPGLEEPPLAEPFGLAVGGSERRKNLPFLIDAVAHAFPQGDVTLTIVGGIDTRTHRVLERTTLPYATYARCDDTFLRRLYRTARAVAVPSLAEGYGLVAVEAMACGAPTIAARTSALIEAVGEGGMLVDADDRTGWIAALRALVYDDAENARVRALGVARWGFAPRDPTTPVVLALMRRLASAAASPRRSRASARCIAAVRSLRRARVIAADRNAHSGSRARPRQEIRPLAAEKTFPSRRR
jgi:glycosyltransferase involved in cell wall biosynthesis